MTCPACFWYHTDPLRAIECYKGLGQRDAGSKGGYAEPSERGSSRHVISTTSNTISRDVRVKSGRAGQAGRPRISYAQKQQKARDRARAYRGRKHGSEAADVPASPSSSVLKAPRGHLVPSTLRAKGSHA